MTATYLGTRCCGASETTPHWYRCTQRLDVRDPASYRTVEDGHEMHGLLDVRPDCRLCEADAEEGACGTCGSTQTVEISDERQSITVCAQCGSDEPGIVLNDTEGEFALCGDCWEKVP